MERFPLLVAGAVLGVLAGAPAVPAAAQESSPACEPVAAFHRLDFWIGEWEVRVGDRVVGHDRIDKIMAGCALMEHWRSITGHRGTSLFYYVPATGTWKQVWVTDGALGRGGVKEKSLVEVLDGGGVRFRGTIPLKGGGSYLDRTTLTPAADGSVRQVIEVSTDGGSSWRATFDAVYVPAAASG